MQIGNNSTNLVFHGIVTLPSNITVFLKEARYTTLGRGNLGLSSSSNSGLKLGIKIGIKTRFG